MQSIILGRGYLVIASMAVSVWELSLFSSSIFNPFLVCAWLKMVLPPARYQEWHLKNLEDKGQHWEKWRIQKRQSANQLLIQFSLLPLYSLWSIELYCIGGALIGIHCYSSWYPPTGFPKKPQEACNSDIRGTACSLHLLCPSLGIKTTGNPPGLRTLTPSPNSTGVSWLQDWLSSYCSRYELIGFCL